MPLNEAYFSLKGPLSIAFCFIFNALLFSQNCLPNGITFGSQTEIENFSVNFPGCTIIDGDVFIMDDGSGIFNLDGLQALTRINGNLVIDINPQLNTINGLAGLQTIDGNLQVSFNASLPNLDGFANLESVNGFIDIVNNASLLNLNGLTNLTSINGFLQVSNNIMLSSIDGLANIDPSTITDLLLQFGDALGFCHLSNLCTYLSEGGPASISGNAKGCLSVEVVLESCGLVSANNQPEPVILLYPNPATDMLVFEGIGEGLFQYSIADFSGIIVKEGVLFDSIPLDIKYLDPGRYVINLSGKKSVSAYFICIQ